MIQHKPIILLSILFTLIILIHPHAMAQSPEDEKTVEVVAKGYGTDVESAEKNAFLNAVEQAVGMLINAETRVNNDDVVEKIISYSDGYVESYKTLDGPKMKNGLYYIKIRAVVKQKELISSLKEENISVGKIEGKSFFAEAITQVEQKKSGQEMLPKIFENFPHRFISVEVFGEPERIEEASDDTHSTILLGFLAKFNKAEYKVWMDAAIPILTQLADKVETLTWKQAKSSSFSRSYIGSTPSPFNEDPVGYDTYKIWKKTIDGFKKRMKTEYKLETDTTLAIGDSWEQVMPVAGYIQIGLLEYAKFGSKLHVFHLKADVYGQLVTESILKSDIPKATITLTDENGEPVTAEDRLLLAPFRDKIINDQREREYYDQNHLVGIGHPTLFQLNFSYNRTSWENHVHWKSPFYAQVMQAVYSREQVEGVAIRKEILEKGDAPIPKVLIGPAFTLSSEEAIVGRRSQGKWVRYPAGFVGPSIYITQTFELANEDLGKISGVEVSLNPASN